MNLVFVRHAHRDTSDRYADNGLSQKGRDQVMRLVHDYEAKKLPNGKHFWTSPKKRCRETLGPMGEGAGITIKVVAELDEQRPGEGNKVFLNRIEQVLEKASEKMETVYLCSHGDFIPNAIEMLTGKSADVRKGEAIVLNFVKGRWEFK